MTGREAVAIAIAAMSLGGCYRTTIHSGQAVGHRARGGDDHWHSGMLAGSKELSGPYVLGEMCGEGWSEIETETSGVNALVGFATFNIYSPQEVSVTCSAPEAPPKPR